MKNQIPRISTRGYYDLTSGKTLKENDYFLYPKKSFERLYGKKEIAIMIHGLRNDKAGAVAKFVIAKKRLKQLGYKHPVIGFSYDANTKGAHIKKTETRALRAGQRIAQKNGKNLSCFIEDFKKQSPNTKIRLLGHSLGTQVILSTIQYLARKQNGKDIVESVHFFGASILSDTPTIRKQGRHLQKIVKRKIINCFCPTDEVLKYAHDNGQVKNPLGLYGAKSRTISKYAQKRVYPKNHRFVSYAEALKSFP